MTDQPIDTLLDALRPEPIEAHLRFLADPLLEGRGAGSRGGRIAEAYVRAAFRGAGLRPVDGAYLQPVPMIGLDPDPRLEFEGPSGHRELAYGDEHTLQAGVPESRVAVDSELVFVGFGISAPEYEWDDFGGMDVAGKVLLIRVNDPGSEGDPAFFGGSALTYYGRWTYKLEEASRRGAAGVLLVHTDESAGYGWNVVRSSNTGEQYHLAGAPEHPLPVRGWISESAARELVAAGGYDLDSLRARSERPDFMPVATGVHVRGAVHSRLRERETANVIGLVPGRADAEPVILSSHHDHLGVTTDAEGGRRIYPGAYDNASGVALLLAMAEAVGRAGWTERRPLLFIATTAEESGLLGAEWYARHPLFPLATTAAVLNVDGVNLFGPTDDIAPLGTDRSSLGPLVEAAARAEGMDVAPEAHPEQGMFFRQDHFPFVRAGVPALAFDHGLRFRERPEGWGEAWYETFIREHYHQPSDAFSEDFDYRGALQQGRVMLRVATAVARQEALPRWNEGSEFRRSG